MRLYILREILAHDRLLIQRSLNRFRLLYMWFELLVIDTRSLAQSSYLLTPLSPWRGCSLCASESDGACISEGKGYL